MVTLLFHKSIYLPVNKKAVLFSAAIFNQMMRFIPPSVDLMPIRNLYFVLIAHHRQLHPPLYYPILLKRKQD